MMDQSLINKLLSLGFKQRVENMFSVDSEDKLFTTMNYWEIFVYFENGKHYISNNGDLVENFDAPNIVIDEAIKNIKSEIAKYGCVLNVSRIVKEFAIASLICAIIAVVLFIVL